MKDYVGKPMFKGFKKDMIAKYGTEKANQIWDYANEEYVKLMENEPDADKTSKSYVFPAVAIYRSVEHFAPGEALEVTRGFGTKAGLRFKKIFSRITALPGIPKLMWKNIDKLAAKMSDGYDVGATQIGGGKCFMDITGCPLYDKAKELGTPEAAQMICCMDKEYMTGFRGIDYKRTKSVAEGDDCCDYRLTKSI